MIQSITWRHNVLLNTQADVAFCTKDEYPDYTGCKKIETSFLLAQAGSNCIHNKESLIVPKMRIGMEPEELE